MTAGAEVQHNLIGIDQGQRPLRHANRAAFDLRSCIVYQIERALVSFPDSHLHPRALWCCRPSFEISALSYNRRKLWFLPSILRHFRGDRNTPPFSSARIRRIANSTEDGYMKYTVLRLYQTPSGLCKWYRIDISGIPGSDATQSDCGPDFLRKRYVAVLTCRPGTV